MRVLVLADETVDAARVRSALPDESDLEGAEVLVVAPALNESRLAFMLSDADEAIADAREVERRSVESLRSEGVSAGGEVGDSLPLLALQDALETFDADLLLLLYGDEDFEGEVRERFGRRTVRA
jgi:hypothetical protein